MADESPEAPGWWNDRLEQLLLALAVLVGAALSVLAAVNQPYNQNEWAQIQPYDSWDPAVVTSGTRQPPLDPILGALVQHAFGVGQLQQRVVPVAAGIGSLIVMALLLRRSRLQLHGVVALWFMATAPVFLRFNAYARPYALPLMLMLVCAYAGSRWLDDGGRRWLALALGSALLLPLARVPEPVVFLGSAALVLLIAGWRRWLPRDRAWWLGGWFLAALVSVGALTTFALGSRTANTGDPLIDLSLSRAIDRLPTGLRELRDFVAPLYAEWFPLWPLTLLVVLLAVVLPSSRKRLATTWWWLPMVLAPLAFLAAYHSVNPLSLEVRHYRIRFAYFWVPSLTVLVALASYGLSRTLGPVLRRGGALAGPVLVVALLLSQLPTTYTVLTRNDTIDVGGATALIERELPHGAIVLYDGPAPADYWRQPFFGDPRYFSDDNSVRVLRNTTKIIRGGVQVRDLAGPIYLLLIDSECVSTVACDGLHVAWDGQVEGFEEIERFDRFTLYAPTEGQAGRPGLIEAQLALAEAYGPDFGDRNLAAAIWLLDDAGRSDEAQALLDGACEDQPDDLVEECRDQMRAFDPLSSR